MFSHVMVGSNDIARSKKFYDALFVAMGAKPGVEDARGRLVYTHNGGRFMVSKPIDGKPAVVTSGSLTLTGKPGSRFTVRVEHGGKQKSTAVQLSGNGKPEPGRVGSN